MKLKILLSAVALTLGASAFAQTKWDLPTAYPATNFHTENITQFAKEVDAATSGKLKITVHANENPLYALDGVPFLATSYPEAMRLYEVSKPALEKLLAAQGIKLLFSVPWAPQGIFSKREVNSVGDLRGIKWRAYSPATAKIAELIGAQPVQIQQAELSAAMATGVIESYMSSGSTGYDTKTYEHFKNFYDTQAWIPKNAVLVNLKSFNALDASTQAALLKVAADAETRGWKMAQEKNIDYKRLLTERGMKIHKPSPKLDTDMRQVGAIMQADWLKAAGADGGAIVNAYQAKK